MNGVTRFGTVLLSDAFESEIGEFVEYADYAKLEAEAQALREEVAAANDRADTLEHRMMGMMTRHFAEAWRNRDTTKELDGYLSAGIAELERERDAALEEVAALRARVVVTDEYAEFEVWLEREKPAGCIGDMERGWMQRARLNGKTVSEGLLRRIVTPAITTSDHEDRLDAMNELRALIGEGKEVGDVLVRE